MKIAILALTHGGKNLGQTLAKKIKAHVIEPTPSIATCLKNLWPKYDAFIMIMATGIVVRTIAPLVQNKHSDPCVIVLDELGRFAISLLSGHLGGGNALAKKIAASIGGQAVITTASDTLNLTAMDLWAKEHNMTLDGGNFTIISSKLVNRGQIAVFSDQPLGAIPEDFKIIAEVNEADLIISNRLTMANWPPEATIFRPANIVIGIGCNRNTPASEIREAVIKTCQTNKLSLLSVQKLASIDLKADEPGLLSFAHEMAKEIIFFNKDQLNAVHDVSCSEAVYAATGAKGVCEPAAILAANSGKLLVRKVKCKNVTVAIAQLRQIPSVNYM